MGILRNGAATFFKLITRCCQYSHFPGFRPALERMVPTTYWTQLWATWDAFCAVWDLIIASDDYPGQIDGDSDNHQDMQD